MKHLLRNITTSAVAVLCAAASAGAQQQGITIPAKPKPPVAEVTLPPMTSAPVAKVTAALPLTPAMPPIELARAAYLAHGGERFRNLKNMVLRGSVDLYAPNSTQALVGQFAVVQAGDKFRMEIQSPAFTMRTIYDGERTYSSMPQFQLPPINKYGYNLLLHIGEPGYTISALPDKKKIGFRVTTQEGSTTDFYLDPKTGRIQRFTIPLGDGISYSVEHKTLKEMDGVLVPVSFVQKFETPQGIFYAESKVKTALLNQTLDDDVFAIPAQ